LLGGHAALVNPEADKGNNESVDFLHVAGAIGGLVRRILAASFCSGAG